MTSMLSTYNAILINLCEVKTKYLFPIAVVTYLVL